jgi:beta-glucosidase/6-phospho-beta-glucosidase/beta-galactosidase
MKWTADTTHPKNIHAEIEEQYLTSLTLGKPDRYGYALYIWENGKGLADELQDDLESAIDGAFERYGVPQDAWKKVE